MDGNRRWVKDHASVSQRICSIIYSDRVWSSEGAAGPDQGGKIPGSRKFRDFRDVTFPPFCRYLTGLVTAVGVSYATLVAAEMIASASGLAWMVLDASKYIQYATVYAGIFIYGRNCTAD